MPSTGTPIRIVLDCNVFLQAVGKGGNHAFACLRLVEVGAVTLLMSEAVLLEISEVLRRKELRALFPLLTEDTVDSLVDWLKRNCLFVDPVEPVFHFPRDPKDEPYINLALAAEEAFVITWDRDLLDLSNIETVEGKRFQALGSQVRFISPKGFIDSFRKPGA